MTADEPAGTPFDIDPDAFAALVRGASDAELAAGLRVNGELLLGEIFRRMPEQVRTEHIGAADALVEWRIATQEGAEPARWQLSLAGGRATVERDGDREPTLILEIGGVDFLRLIADAALGPQLFLTGRLRATGDLMLAAQLPSLFRLPNLA